MASRTDPPAPTDTEMMTMSLSDKPPGASVEGRGVLPGSASVGDWIGGIVLLSLVVCEASGVGCRISEVTPVPLPTSIVPKPSSICEVVVGVSMVGWVDVWGGAGGEGRGVVGMVGGVDIWGGAGGEGLGEVGMVGGVDIWGGGGGEGLGEVGMVGGVDIWGGAGGEGLGEVGMVGGVDIWGGAGGEGLGEVGMVGGVDIWGGAGGEGLGEVGMVGGVDIWGGGGGEGLGAIVLPGCNEFCALASSGRMLNATAASSKADNTWLWQYCAIVL